MAAVMPAAGPHPLDPAVAALLRRVAAEVVMPRFGALAEGDVAEKEPGEYVTVADREAEERLAAGLTALLPAARVIGEEAVAADESLLEGIGRGLAWIVDPIDGTHNFTEGKAPFALMVALVEDGETRAGWIYDPLAGRMCHAALGGGAFVDGVATTARGTGDGLPLVALATRYLPEAERALYRGRSAGRLRDADIPRCAGEQYPRVMLGGNDAALFWRALPWDHAAGALILAEAGGRVARLDGRPYRVDQRDTGLLAAATPALWDEVRRVLAG